MNPCGIPEISQIGSRWKLWRRRWAATVEVPDPEGLALCVNFTFTKRGAETQLALLKKELL